MQIHHWTLIQLSQTEKNVLQKQILVSHPLIQIY